MSRAWAAKIWRIFCNALRVCFFFIGSGFEGCAPAHNAHFQVHDHILAHGIEIFCRATLRLLLDQTGSHSLRSLALPVNTGCKPHETRTEA